jgi:SNF2 family DNA or RNA helicase
VKYVFKTKPYKHQVKALRRAMRQGSIGVLWEPGMGKSKLVVDWASALFQKGDIRRVLIVCPLSVVGVWEDEFEIHSPVDYKIQFLDRKTERLKKYKGKLTVTVANYDIVWRRPGIVRAYDAQLVVADESHRIKKASTKRSWFMRSLNKTPHRAILTGTPVPKSFLDLYGQWVFLNPKTFGTRVNDFKERYITFGGFGGHQIRGYHNVDELKEKVKGDATIRRKDQALDLPDKIYQRIPVILEPEARKQYNTLAEEFFLELSKGEVVDVKNAVVKLLRLQQITGGWINTDQGMRQISKAKIKAMRDLLDDMYEEQQKVVVFSRFRPEIEGIVDAAKKAGYKKVYELTGSTPKDQRSVDRREFQSISEPAVFVAQIQTGGLGITLHSAHQVIFYSVTHALDDYIQACDRVHRIGQTEKVTYRHLVGVGTVDVDIYAALRAKEDVMRVIMGKPNLLTRRK